MLTTVLYVVLAILLVTTLYVVVRTLRFAWRQRAVVPVEGIPVDGDCVAEHLAAAIRCQTVPLDDKGTPDPEAFAQLHQMLEQTYPLVHRSLKREVINGFSLLYTWEGTQPDLEPVMVMAHQDVVSADPASLDQWTYPPFEGRIAGGFIWGRGTLDIKNQLIGIMEAAEVLLARGFRPERTILFGLGHDEETGGVNGCMEDNTIPSEAKATVNFRLLPGDTIAEVLERAAKIIDDERVTITPVPGKFNEALPVSPDSGPAYEGLKQVIRELFANPPVAPFVMLGGTDCQHFLAVCDHIYRFTSLVMDASFMGLEHGIDERIPVQGMSKMVQFYARLMQVWGVSQSTA